MKFDVIVGNPPYQMEVDAAGRNIASIYNLFIEQARHSIRRSSRW